VETEWKDFDEMQGVVTIEIKLATRSMAADAKHTDPEEQTEGLRYVIIQGLQRVFDGVDDTRIGAVEVTGFRDERWTDWSSNPPAALE
jgi:hypothetical protein